MTSINKTIAEWGREKKNSQTSQNIDDAGLIIRQNDRRSGTIFQQGAKVKNKVLPMIFTPPLEIVLIVNAI